MIQSLAQAAAPSLSVDDVLSPYTLIFFAAFAISFLATPVMRMLAINNGVVDLPDRKRKIHLEPVPYLGGVAIFLGWLGGMSLVLFINPGFTIGNMVMHHVSIPISIVLGAAVIVFVGLIDDVYGSSPRVKVGGQLIAAAALASNNVGTVLMTQTFQIAGWQSPPFMLCYILGGVMIAAFVLGGCNSVNLLDGLDGLASGVTAIAMLGFIFIAVYVVLAMDGPNAELAAADPRAAVTRLVICIATLGALLGFLPYNFNPASIFMGDAGSLLLGYLSVTAILLFAHTAAKGPFFVMAALIVFAVPITDTALAIVRRKMRGQPLFSPDNQHIHHQLAGLMKSFGLPPNLSVKAAVFTIYGLSMLFALLGSAMIYLRWRYVMAVFVFIFGFVIVTAYKSGHRQLVLAQRGELPPAEEPTPSPEANSPRDESKLNHG